MAHPQAIQILGQMKDTSFQVSHLWSPGGCDIWLRRFRPDFNNCPGDNLNSGHILVPGIYSSPTQIMAPLQVIPILVKWKIHLFRSPTYGLLVVAILAKDPRSDFSNGKWITRILAAFCPLPPPPPSVYSSPLSIMAPLQAIPILEC